MVSNSIVINSGTNVFDVYEPEIGMLCPNSIVEYTGSKPAVGRFLMRGSDLKEIQTDVTIEISDGTRTVIREMLYVAKMPASISAEDAGSIDDETIYEAIFMDYRRYLCDQTLSVQQFNVLRTNQCEYISRTLNAGSEWTWAEIFAELGVVCPDTLSWIPDNLIFKNASKADAINYIANVLSYVAAWDRDGTSGVMTYYAPGDIVAANTTMLGNAVDYSTTHNFNGTTPIESILRNEDLQSYSVQMWFPTLCSNNLDFDELDYLYSGTATPYTNNVEMKFPHYVLHAWDEGGTAGVAVWNDSDAQTITDEIGARHIAKLELRPNEITFAGAWDFKCDGWIRAVEICCRNGITTRIKINDDRDFYPFADIERAIDGISNLRSSIVGTHNSEPSPGGGVIHIPLYPEQPSFVAKCSTSCAFVEVIQDDNEDWVVLNDGRSGTLTLVGGGACPDIDTIVKVREEVRPVYDPDFAGYEVIYVTQWQVAYETEHPLFDDEDYHTDVFSSGTAGVNPGDIIYRDAGTPNEWTNLAIGDVGDKLVVGGDSLPEWTADPASNLVYKQHRIKVLNTSSDGSYKFDDRDWREKLVHVELASFWGFDEFEGGYEIIPEESQYAYDASSPSVKHGTFWCGNNVAGAANAKLPMIFVSGVTWVILVEIDKTTGELYWTWQSMSYAEVPVYVLVRVMAFEDMDTDNYTTT